MNYDIKARCKFCDRYLKIKAVKSSHIVVTCQDRRCKKDNEIKVVMLSDLVKQHR